MIKDSKQWVRTIRSYVVRAGRLNKTQQAAIDNAGERLKTLDDVLTPGDALMICEIGFGMGDSLLAQASKQPETQFIGIDVYPIGVGQILANSQAQGLDNLTVYQADAVEVFDRCIPDGCFDRIQVFFPDPWPKKRHHKRRLIQKPLVEQLIQKLKLGGVLHCATDWAPYAEHMQNVFNEVPALTLDTSGSIPNFREPSKYEQRGLRLGHQVFDFLLQKS